MSEAKKRSERRRAENEVIFKEHNERIQQQISSIFDKAAKQDLLIGYICECADETCHEQVKLTAEDYTKLRRNKSQFFILPGHEQPDIEHIVNLSDRYILVEKYHTPPTTDGHLNKTH